MFGPYALKATAGDVLCGDLLSLVGVDPHEKYFTIEWDEAWSPKELCTIVGRIYRDFCWASSDMDAQAVLRDGKRSYVHALEEYVRALESLAQKREKLPDQGEGSVGESKNLAMEMKQYGEDSLAALKEYLPFMHGAHILLLVAERSEEEYKVLEADLPMALSALLELARKEGRDFNKSRALKLKMVVTPHAALCASVLIGRMKQLALLYATDKLQSSMASDEFWYLASVYLTVPIDKAYARAGTIGENLTKLCQKDNMGLYDEYVHVKESGGGHDNTKLRSGCTRDVMDWIKDVALDSFRQYSERGGKTLYNRYFSEKKLEGITVDEFTAVLEALVRDVRGMCLKPNALVQSTFAVRSVSPGYALARSAQAAIKALNLIKEFNKMDC